MNKKIISELKKFIKKLEGSLLSISIEDETILKEIEKNKKIADLYNLTNSSKKSYKNMKNKGLIDIKINKLSKKIGAKVDYIICDLNGINTYLNVVVKQSYKIVNKKIYFYGITDIYEVNKLINKYKRYNCIVSYINESDSYLIEIDTSNIKIKWYKKIIYSIYDVLLDINDAIGNGLMQ